MKTQGFSTMKVLSQLPHTFLGTNPLITIWRFTQKTQNLMSNKKLQTQEKNDSEIER